MTENAVMRARINEDTKRTASAVLASMGLTVSDAFRMMMVRIAAEKRLPFDPLVPNEETVAAMEDARAGRTTPLGGIEDLMTDLHAKD